MTDADLVYGVDFGTSTSALVIGRRGLPPMPVRDPAATAQVTSIPTTVCRDTEGNLLVGHAAEAMRLRFPESHHAEFKRDFGSDLELSVGDRLFRPHELATEVLRFLRQLAEKTVPGTPDAVVITVPAVWEEGNETLMRSAAEQAGFDPNVLHIAPEPVAALAHAFAERHPEAGRVYCVYDLGGGTFDAAVARSTGDSFVLLGSPGGLRDAGGARIDRLILGRARDLFPDEADDLFFGPTEDQRVLADRRRLLEQCVQMKVQLSVVPSYGDYLSAFGNAYFELTREALRDLVAPMLGETLDVTSTAVTACGITWNEIDAVVPVGGSSRLAAVGEAIGDRHGRTVLRISDPDLAVALGAALLAREVSDAVAVPPGIAPDSLVARILRAGLSEQLIKSILRRY